jgi:antirestriction protein ArdC
LPGIETAMMADPSEEHPMTEKTSVYDTITTAILAAAEDNPGTPKLPWHTNAGQPLHMPSNAVTKNTYRGINIVSLWVTAEVRGYGQPIYATYRQWAQLGAQVRKGEKSTAVIFYKEFDTEPDANTPDDDGKRRMARSSSVFNCQQVDGFDAPAETPNLGPVERTAAFDAFVTSTGAIIAHGGERAFYRPSIDSITMPDEHRFCGTGTMTRDEGYMSVLAHELGHWSGAPHRLDRTFGKRFGDAAHVAEEIVAELTAALICAELGICSEPRPDHAQYIAHYLKLLRADNRAIFTAAAQAAKAVDYLKGLANREQAAA